MRSVGVRELRQNATEVLRDVARGETVIITSNGHPVAQIIAPVNDPWTALIASGEVTRARTGPRAILSRPAHSFTPASPQLAAMRRGER